jgi:hypothetical protein
LVEAAKRCFNLSITGELPPSRLRQGFQHIGQMCWIDRLRRTLIARKRKHGSGDLVLASGGNFCTASSACLKSLVMAKDRLLLSWAESQMRAATAPFWQSPDARLM